MTEGALKLDMKKNIISKEQFINFMRHPYFRLLVLVVALLCVWIFFGFFTNGLFFSSRNLSNLMRQMTIISFLAMGMTFVIISGHIDISVGSISGLTSMIAACSQAIWLPPILGNLFQGISAGSLGTISTIITIIITMLAGGLIGLIQGILISYGLVSAFVITLGGQYVWRGVILLVSNSRTVTPIEDSLRLIAQGYLTNILGWFIAVLFIILIVINMFRKRNQYNLLSFTNNPLHIDIIITLLPILGLISFVIIMNSYRGIANPVLLMLMVGALLAFVLNGTTFGRHVYAIGGNREAASLTGINIKKVELKVFILMGLMCGISGIVLTGYVAAGTVAGGFMFELMAIASCFIGGVRHGGGEGTLVGAMIGCLFMTSLDNGMSVMNLEVYWQYIVKGSVLAMAVYWDMQSRKRFQS